MEDASEDEGLEVIFDCQVSIADFHFIKLRSRGQSEIGNLQSKICYVENHSLDGCAWCWKRHAGALAS